KAMNQPQNLQPQPASGNQTTFSFQELARNNGKDGNPAYVAVNGMVYDVTNNAAWAAATHFGMTAGKDLTSEFASCHAGQPILNKLKIVGKLK
ncbi:MAG: cytochrome b5 domain-containing protein, partial [Solirubrobacterales bacterium]